MHTQAMFISLAAELAALYSQDARIFLSLKWAVFDWAGLGLLTGAGLGKYAQSKPVKGQPYQTVPHLADAGEWAGTLLAFICSDFTFYDINQIHLSLADCSKQTKRAAYLHVCFHFDTSKTNFSVEKFSRISGSILCPVK
jgi:hypothetical protein